MAQSTQPEGAVTVGDVVVTAQRREQSLQDVPIAITAFNAETLERTAATGIQDVAGKAPGVTLTQFNIGEPQIFIRGVGTTSDSAASARSPAYLRVRYAIRHCASSDTACHLILRACRNCAKALEAAGEKEEAESWQRLADSAQERR